MIQRFHNAKHWQLFAGEFFLLWFHPIGIWFIQPKVNAIVSGNYNPAATSYFTNETDLLDE